MSEPKSEAGIITERAKVTQMIGQTFMFKRQGTQV